MGEWGTRMRVLTYARYARRTGWALLACLAWSGVHTAHAQEPGTVVENPISSVWAFTFDSVGNIYVSTGTGNTILKYGVDGSQTRYAGTGRYGYSGDGGDARQAELALPNEVETDDEGNLYIADSDNLRIRKVTRQGVISTYAGTGDTGPRGDGVPANEVVLGDPSSLYMDHDSTLYVTTYRNIRKVNSEGIISTLFVYSRRDNQGQPIPHDFSGIGDLEIDSNGIIYVSHSHPANPGSYRISTIAPDGKLTYYLGTRPAGCEGEECPVIESDIDLPAELAIDDQDQLFIGDWRENKIYKVSGGAVTQVAGAGVTQPVQLIDLEIDTEGNLVIGHQKVLKLAAPAARRLTVTTAAPASRPGDTVQVTVSANGPLSAAPSVDIAGSCLAMTPIPVQPAGEANTYTGTFTVPAGNAGCVATIEARGEAPTGEAYRGGAALVTLDPTAPATAIALSGTQGGNGWHTSAVGVTLAFTDPDPSSGLANLYYGLDQPACAPESLENCSVYAEPFQVSADGEHTLVAFSRDRAGHFSAVQQAAFKINATPPVAGDQSLTLPEDSTLEVTLTATDAAGEPLAYAIVSEPVNGSLGTVSGSSVTYTPDPDFHGSDSFTFRAADGNFESNIAMVTLTITPVNDPPVVQAAAHTGHRDRELPVVLVASDPDGDPLTYAIVTPPEHGLLSGTAPDLTYTPATGYTGSDQFAFTASDGQAESLPATVSLNLLPTLLQIGGGTGTFYLEPGEARTLLISTTAEAQGVAGLELKLRVVAPEGAPPLVPEFERTEFTQGWQMLPDTQDPWRITMFSASGFSGAADLLRLTVQASPQAPLGTVYRLEPETALFTSEQAVETNVEEQTAEARVEVRSCEVRARGDVTGEGQVNVLDAVETLRIIVNLSVPDNACAVAAADVSCDGAIRIGDAILILRHIVFDEAFPACP